ncbi:MAG: hypothetical protein Q8P99_01920 [bacterium]|nr:hypothetical protein [bacterium]
MGAIHKEMAAGRWYEYSFDEQMGNIGSEVSRAAKWQHKDEKLFWGAIERGLELFNLTLDDPRWATHRKRKINRAKEVFVDAIYGGKEYQTSLEELMPYFDYFALRARAKQ